MGDPLGMLLFKEKQVRLLLKLLETGKEWHISDLAKATDITYVHTSKFISRCEQEGLIKSEKHGRTKRLLLTEKGTEIATSISKIMGKINLPSPPQPQEQPPPPDKR